MKSQTEILIEAALESWRLQIKRTDNLLYQLTDEQMQNEISPNRNRGIYLLGHLTAVHDRMLPLLNLEPKLFPELDATFIQHPDKSIYKIPSVIDLRLNWKIVNRKLEQHFESLKSDEWFKKHNAVSDEVFKNEPNRNRLNVLLNRTNHLSYHFGQLALLKK